jgi:EmrB/QacA subfamily drug resistance transporter
MAAGDHECMDNILYSAGPSAAVLERESSQARRQRLVLWVCCISLFMTCVDYAIVVVALSGIQSDLHAQVSGLQWVTDAYLLVLSSALLLAGATADRWGRRRLFIAGLVLFTAGSAWCGLASGLGVLIAARAVQGLGAAMLGPASLSIVRHTFTDPAERARAFGIWSAVFGIGMACGPVLGGPLIDLFGWRAVFFVNVPIGLVAIVVGRLVIAESRAAQPRRLDPPGQVSMVMFIAPLTYAVIQGSTLGWTDPVILAAFAVSAVGLAGFIVAERRSAEPMLDVRYFARSGFRTANIAVALAFAVMVGFLFIISLYLQQERHLSPIVAGLALLPVAGGIALFAPLAGSWVARRGPHGPMIVAGLCIAAGGALLVPLSASTPYLQLLVALLLVGAGLGLINPPGMAIAVSALPVDQAGVASAAVGASRQIGNTLGIAVMGAMLGAQATKGMTATTHGPFLLGTGLGLLITAAALQYRRREPRLVEAT